eukprot:CAMPEP_0119515416 /NCGR_PEP_ID=MMETSP1344-20130328/32915_1 /TAXON_ID=236787 /ORGANISM="Florenciella parvula, Strain CCMP2471" /LENGTH=51 /DNA_ID=CAMNT_0007552823 /DNA_START=193 /DNA_END=345 /DNA_ORIENTATION=+
MVLVLISVEPPCPRFVESRKDAFPLRLVVRKGACPVRQVGTAGGGKCEKHD